MAYEAYETADGEALAQLGSMCRHAARLDGTFGPDTIPRIAEVLRFLDIAYYWVQAQLSKVGIDQVQTAPGVISWLQDLMVLEAAIRVELSLPASDESGAPTERYNTLVERLNSMLADLASGVLSTIGATVDSTNPRVPAVTGLSYSRKDILDANADATQQRVKRDQFSRNSRSWWRGWTP